MFLNDFKLNHSPEETLPGREVGALKERVFQDSLDTTQGLDHVCSVIVQVPQFAVVALVGPPERILLQHLQTQRFMVIFFYMFNQNRLIAKQIFFFKG